VRHRSVLSLSLLVTALALSRCACFEDVAAYNQVVFSDDDTRLLVVELRYEERQSIDPLAGTSEKQNFRHQLYTTDLDGSSPVEFGSEQPGQNGAEVYDMKTAGYALVSALDENGALRFVRFDDAGATRTLPSPGFTAQPVFALPSPDGAHIAQLAVDGDTASVRFIDAATLSPIGDEVSLPFVQSIDWTFRPDGKLVVTDFVTAMALEPGTAPEPADVPGCTNPKTTSSPLSSTGVFVFVAGDAEVATTDEGQDLAFGCQ
jgi:hypothetical protein